MAKEIKEKAAPKRKKLLQMLIKKDSLRVVRVFAERDNITLGSQAIVVNGVAQRGYNFTVYTLVKNVESTLDIGILDELYIYNPDTHTVKAK